MEQLKIPLGDIEAKAVAIRDYFAEDAATYKLETFMESLQRFLERFNTAIKVRSLNFFGVIVLGL